MAAPYSLDLRERVVAAVAAGMSRKKAAMHYQVSPSSANRWTRRLAETGSPAALPMGGNKPFTLADEETWIRDRIEEKPDMTGRELLAELNQRGIEVGYYAVWHFLDHVGLSFKKKVCTPANRIGPTSRADGVDGSSTRRKSPPDD
jgi:transposase